MQAIAYRSSESIAELGGSPCATRQAFASIRSTTNQFLESLSSYQRRAASRHMVYSRRVGSRSRTTGSRRTMLCRIAPFGSRSSRGLERIGAGECKSWEFGSSPSHCKSRCSTGKAAFCFRKDYGGRVVRTTSPCSEENVRNGVRTILEVEREIGTYCAGCPTDA